jgi:protease-4
MKNFFTSMLGALAALVIFAGGCFLLFIGFVAAIAAMGTAEQAAPSFERGAYVVYDLTTQITDAPPPLDLSAFGGRPDSVQLRTVTRALRSAATDDRIAGVFITGDLSVSSFSSGYAALREIRNALAEVKAAGKPVIAYLTHATTRSYYLASVASELSIDPYGLILMPGLASEPTFFTGFFEKYGVNVQVSRVGKYKSAVEPFIRKDMSPENREEVQKLLGDLWGTLLGDIAPSRDLTPEKIQAVIDSEGILRADVAKEQKFVDRVAYRDEIYDELKAKTGRAGSKEPFKQVTISDYAKIAKDVVDKPAPAVEAPKAGGRGQIAIVYAEGEIVDGEGDAGQIGGTKFSRALRRIRQDEAVKAVVLRVNSPGGSASASEVIQREIRLMKKVKPVVISMGSYAASGGYWISTYGDRIFAEPSTITGSIGVFGMQFDIQKLANNFGFTFDVVKTGKFADAVTISRAKTPEEMAIFQKMVDWIYGEFIGKVAESRQLTRDQVEQIAQGRVWSGAEAVKIGLVDELGGLDAAVAFAAQKAGLGANYRLQEYPHHKELIEALQDLIEQNTPGFAQSNSIAARLTRHIEAELKFLQSFNDPKGIYARLPMNLNVR